MEHYLLPNNFKQYRQVASNTGIVPIVTLEELFPQYSSEMLVGCLESMEFCHSVDPSVLFKPLILKATLSSPLHQEPTISSSQVLLKSIDLATSPPQGLAGVWGAATLTSFSAIVSYTFFSFDLHSYVSFEPARIVHSPPLCVVSSGECKVWRNGIIWTECLWSVHYCRDCRPQSLGHCAGD